MTDKQFLRLNDDWALAYDRQQWIVQKRLKDVGRGEWRSDSFIGSNKRVLMRVIHERDITPTQDACARLKRLPHKFLDWYRDEIASNADYKEAAE